MKKISIMLLAALMLFAFVACDNTTDEPEDNAIKLSSVTYGEGESAVTFENDSDTKLATEDGVNYTVTGTLAEMNADQAKAFGETWNAGSQFVGLDIKFGINGSATYGWVSETDAEKETVPTESWYDQKTTEGFEDTQASWQMVLAVTNGETVREDLKTKPVWRIEITDTDTDDVTVYTVNLKSVIDAAAAEN